VTNPDGTFTVSKYHVAFNPADPDFSVERAAVLVRDANGHFVRQSFDAFGRLQTVSEFLSGVWTNPNGWPESWGGEARTRYVYDVRDNLKTVTDAAGNASTITYDMLGRKTYMKDPDMGQWYYGYDAVGNLTSQKDAKNQTIYFTYDALNRLTFKNLPSGTDVNYQYDNVKGDATAKNSWGKLRLMYTGSESSNGHLYEYDDRGRTVKEQVEVDSATYNTSYSYDAADRVKTMTYPDNEVVTTAYNTQGLPVSLRDQSSYYYAKDATYDTLGRLDFFKLANGGRQTDYVYFPWTQLNGQGRLQQIKTGTLSTPTSLQSLTYTYDAVGNVKTIADGKVSGGTQTQNFNYDALDRLTSASASGGGSGQGQHSESYAYNAIGNMTSKAGVSYTYPASGASSVRPHAVRRVTGSGGSAKTIQIRAYSTPCYSPTGERATMELWVNGVKKQTWPNAAASWTTYQQSVTLSGNDQIDVVFTNDCSAGGYDRNLYVDYVVVDGRTIQAEGGAAIIDKGTGNAAFDGLNVVAGSQSIWWSAALRFVVGEKASAACYDENGNMTWRLQDGVAYEQTWDSENHLTAVLNHATGQTTSFTYDGDGALVKKAAYENLASGRTATSSSTLNWPGVVANEDTWANSGSGSSGEFAYTSQTGLQYVQIDLGAVYTVDRVKVWHYAGDGRTYHNTKTQVSSDGTNWTTVFDSAVSGEYAETAAGKTHTFTARSVRYVRDYLNGSTSNAGNHWVEIEVWGARTTVQVGAHYEKDVTGGQVTKYYFFGTQRVAMNK
jgi:YD repeat-containing protein